MTARRFHHRFATGAALAALLLASAACRESANEHDHPAPAPAATRPADRHAATEANHVAIPPRVRENLGITFVRAERRPVRGTLRIAGVFELRPSARREYHVMVPGRITLLVEQYQRVAQDQPLFHLDSPAWQELQRELVDALNAMKRSHADVAVAEATLNELQQSVAFLEQRISNLAEAQVRRVELEADLTDKRNALPRLQAELDAAQTEFDTMHARYDVMLSTAAALTGLPRTQLDADTDSHGHVGGAPPPWRALSRLTIRAEAAGVVDRLPVTNQGWAETGDLVLDTIDPDQLRFHADALQTDINRFHDGQPARIVPPPGGSFDLQDTVDGHIVVGVEAHAAQRTVPIYLVPDKLPRWAKPGVTAYLEVFTSGAAEPVVAVPEATLVRDGLEYVLFKRDPDDPDHVIRIPVRRGPSDNRWVAIESDVAPGDEVVLDGVYPLMLATSAGDEHQPGAHVHPDGTVHTGEDH